jgi:hypothetical protein
MEMAERIAAGGLAAGIKRECPFSHQAEGVASEESEHLNKDDLASVEKEQHNDGGVLGKNLVTGSQGRDGTVGGPKEYDLAKASGVPREDTRRSGVHVRVPGASTVREGTYGFTVAAHHLIPGEASLAPSDLKPFMTRGESVTVTTRKGQKSKTISRFIGYNVNGAHNGVWLPGNYFIRARNSPIKGKSWGDLGDHPWCLNYAAAVSKAAGGQIHDAHTKYSAAVKKLLNKIACILGQHECDECRPSEINPPFRIKLRLFALSRYLRTQVTAAPEAWKRPWFTSDRWRDAAFAGGKPSKAFMDAYERARRLQRGGR